MSLLKPPVIVYTAGHPALPAQPYFRDCGMQNASSAGGSGATPTGCFQVPVWVFDDPTETTPRSVMLEVCS